jgi:hypothetical protein
MSKIALSLALVLAAASTAIGAPKHHHRGVVVQAAGTETFGSSVYGYPTPSSSGYGVLAEPYPDLRQCLCP